MKKPANYGKPLSDIGKPVSQQLIWDDTRAFLAIARYGTLSAAAHALHIGIATLSRRIDRLEDTLNIPLFIRHQSGYKLTDEGVLLVDKAEALEDAAQSFMSQANVQADIVGKVRLATAENLATSLIIPALPHFKARYPDLVIELVTDISTVNLHRREADLAIRMVRPDRGNVSLRKLGTLGYGLYGSQDYLAHRTTDLNSAYHDHDDFITWHEMKSHLPAAQWVERILRGRSPALTTTSLATQITAAKSGMGLAVLPHFLALDAGLTCVKSDIGIEQPIYLVIHSDLTQSRRIRVLADFLADLIEDHKNLLANGDRS